MIEYENLHQVNQPFISELRAVLSEVLNDGRFILGRQVEEFEKEFAAYCGASHCVGVGNGMDALMLALRCFGFKEGSEVIVPANTYIASILSIVNCGLKPVLIEPKFDTCNIDPNLIAGVITPKTVAIMVVHLYGKVCEMHEILPIAKEHNLRVIEDCAHAHGASYKGKKAGTFGDFGAYSFYPTKNLGALGDAGALVTSHSDLADKVRSMRNYGSLIKDEHDSVGFNSRLDEIQAGFLRVKLQALDRMNQQRRLLAKQYTEHLKEQFIKPSIDHDYFDVYHIYAVRHPKRDKLKQHLLDHGVETRIHYPIPPHRQKALHHLFESSSLPVTEEMHATTLSLPISTMHTELAVTRILEVMNNF